MFLNKNSCTFLSVYLNVLVRAFNLLVTSKPKKKFQRPKYLQKETDSIIYEIKNRGNRRLTESVK